MESLEDLLIPIVFFGTVFAITFVVVWYRHRTRAAAQETLRLAIQQGQSLDSETIQTLTGYTPPSGDRDVRRGVLLLAVAAAIAGFGVLLDEPDASGSLYGTALFPLLIGGAYLLMSRLARRPD